MPYQINSLRQNLQKSVVRLETRIFLLNSASKWQNGGTDCEQTPECMKKNHQVNQPKNG
jgi:hypothetical protein